MRIKPHLWKQALEFRCHLASEYRKYNENSDAKAGDNLVALARALKLTSRNRPILGNTLLSYSKKGTEVPYWVAMTIIVYIANRGYTPETELELDLVVSHVAKDVEYVEAHSVATKLFPHIPSQSIQASLIRIKA